MWKRAFISKLALCVADPILAHFCFSLSLIGPSKLFFFFCAQIFLWIDLNYWLVPWFELFFVVDINLILFKRNGWANWNIFTVRKRAHTRFYGTFYGHFPFGGNLESWCLTRLVCWSIFGCLNCIFCSWFCRQVLLKISTFLIIKFSRKWSLTSQLWNFCLDS
jgi:hypothetical protein